MYDDITALMGGASDPKEKQMADALRNKQQTGNFFGMSTLEPIARMGRNMSDEANTAAKAAGGLAQSRMALEQRREDRKATDAYRTNMLGLSQARIDQQSENSRLAEENRLRDDKRRAEQDRINEEIKRERLDISRKKANINAAKNNNVLNNLGGLLGQNVAVLKGNIAAGLDAEKDPEAPPPEVKVGEWAAANGADDAFKAQVIKDTKDLATLTELPPSGIADAVINSGPDTYAWTKYMYDLTGRTGIIPHVGKSKSIPTGVQKVLNTSSQNLAAMANQMSSYNPEYSAKAPLVNTVLNKATQYGVGTDKQKTEANWWGNLNQFYTMPERHEMFGSALTQPETESWKKSAINENMDDYQIRHAMATRLYIMRTFAERQIKAGLAEGYSMETLRNKYDFLPGTNAGTVNPDTPEGIALLRAGWKSGEDPAKYLDGEGGKPAAPFQYKTREEMMNMSEEEFNAYEAAVAAQGGS